MTKQEIRKRIEEICGEVPGNIIKAEQADYPEVAGLQLYDGPLTGFGSADDPIFEKYKEPGVVGPWMLGPKQWLPAARTVISVFLPFTDRVKSSNALMTDIASHEWAYARVEGQAYLIRCMNALAEWFRENGAEAAVPMGDPRFFQIVGGRIQGAVPENIQPEALLDSTYSSNWSERHAAFACGLGTFGMSRGLITAKGVAGRFGSVIVSTALEADERPYRDIYEYCIRCGACAAKCPPHAFPASGGPKDHQICEPHMIHTAQVLKPRYGCGLCQVGVPCQDRIPGKRD